MTTYFKRFKQFSKYESSWSFWILNVRWKYLAGTLLRFRCFPSVIACHRWVLGWKMWQTLDGARLRGWSPHRKILNGEMPLGVNHWRSPQPSWSSILRFASTCTISGLRDFAIWAILKVWLHRCHSVLHVFCSVRQGNETRMSVLNVQRRCSNLFATLHNETVFSPKLDKKKHKEHTSHLCACGKYRLLPMRKSREPRCLPGWRWSPKSWPSKPTWWSCSHALFKWKHTKDEKSTPNTWKTCITCDWTTLGALMWVWSVQRFVNESGLKSVGGGVGCLSVIASRHSCDHAETLSSRDTNGDLVRGQVSPCQIDRRKWPFTYANSFPVCWVTPSLYITY